MCRTCAGQIILRTGDGLEKIVSVDNCDIYEYKTMVMDRHHTRNYVSFNSESFSLSETIIYRLYRFKGEMQYGIRILDEVIMNNEPVKIDLKVSRASIEEVTV